MGGHLGQQHLHLIGREDGLVELPIITPDLELNTGSQSANRLDGHGLLEVTGQMNPLSDQTGCGWGVCRHGCVAERFLQFLTSLMPD